MGSKIGTMKIAAKRLGISFEDYLALVNSGLKWCTKCRSWKHRGEFGLDATRGDGLDSKCYSCRSRTISGPTKRERGIKAKDGLSWCRRCNKWLTSGQIKGGLCRSHRAEWARERYHNNELYRLERKQHSHSRKRNVFSIPADVQKEILADFEGKCAYCQKPATTWDHVIPITQKGNSTPGNIVPCCLACNSSKNATDLYEWIEKTDKQNLHPRLLDILSLAECVHY